MPQVTVTSGGRLFKIFGSVTPQQQELPWRNKLVAFNGYNGTVLWKRYLPDGMAVATSGNYERYFSPDKKVNHIMDPRTGFSVSSVISVSIICESGTQADALSTSVFVLGVKDGMKLVESLHNVECYIVDYDRIIHTSSGIDKYLVQSK